MAWESYNPTIGFMGRGSNGRHQAFRWNGEGSPTVAAPDGRWHGYEPFTQGSVNRIIGNAAENLAVDLLLGQYGNGAGQQPADAQPQPGALQQLAENQFLRQIYGTRDTNSKSQTYGQTLAPDPNFLALLNNPTGAPAIPRQRPVDPQSQLNAQQSMARKLAFMTNPGRGMPTGPPMARDNGQAAGG